MCRCLEFYKAALLDFFEWNASGMGSLHEQELNTIIWEVRSVPAGLGMLTPT